MQISKVTIQNFRNFENIIVNTSQNLLLVGSNATGKSNFIYALRLVLDSSLSRRDRMLTGEDFWRGNGLLPWQGRIIKISVIFTNFYENQNLLSFLADYGTIENRTDEATITYIFKPKGNILPENSQEADYEFRIYGGDDENNEVTQFFRYFDLRIIDALRNAESELIARRTPLKSLLDLYGINKDELSEVVEHLQAANEKLQDISTIQTFETDIKDRIKSMQEHVHELDPVLGLAANSPDDVIRALRILLEKDRLLPISATSLGLANILFLALSMLEVEKRESITKPIGEDAYEFIILAIEEPEAHLHPHVQRILFRDFLRRSPLILSTHSPHIACVAPIDSIVMFRKPNVFEGTEVHSTANLSDVLEPSEISDIERYLDITRAEILFARGVIFVEGDAEEFAISVFARLAGYELDKYGITVCNIKGTNFKPYIKFVSKHLGGINIPFVVVTDGDKFANLVKVALPRAKKAEIISDEEQQYLKGLSKFDLRTELEDRGIAYYDGLKRCLNLLDLFQVAPETKAEIENNYHLLQWEIVIDKLQEIGIFVNDWSFEPTLIESGYASDILEILDECEVGPKIILTLREQFESGKLSLEQTDYWVKQINSVGKGRVGQRLSAKLMEVQLPGGREIPRYIDSALKYLVELLQSAAQSDDEAISSSENGLSSELDKE